MSSSFKLFYDYFSPLSRSIIILLEHNKVVYEKTSVALRKGEHLSKEYGQNVNRHHKVPVIHDNDGLRLAETVAIYHYLGRKGIISERWYPTDVKKLMKIDEFLQWNHNSLLLTTGSIFYEAWLKHFKDISGTEHGMMKNVRDPTNFVDIHNSLNMLENVWLENKKFLVDDEPTYAELIASCALMQVVGLRLFAIDNEKYPKVSRWLQDTKDYFNPEFDTAHQYIYKYGERFNGPPKIGLTIRAVLFLRNLMNKS
ncbi:unnamed protein product [Chironomus riparius]|uniref:Glutathione s-transferase n=1 Tax=Chironomus riparius TaxID=315576 RepID=A0A9N9WRB8_9DIPT|nr:unnamed protein product [Chironomus riparius]